MPVPLFITSRRKLMLKNYCSVQWIAWGLSLNQIADLFEKDKSVISRRLKNIYRGGELEARAIVAKNATVQIEWKLKWWRKKDLKFINFYSILFLNSCFQIFEFGTFINIMNCSCLNINNKVKVVFGVVTNKWKARAFIIAYFCITKTSVAI